MTRRLLHLFVPLLLAAATLPAFAAEAPAPVAVLSIEGGIGPAIGDFIQRGLAKAQKSGAQLLVIKMDTPGGLDTIDAPDHQGHPRVPSAGGGVCRPERRPGRECRHLYPVREPRRRHGARHESRRRDAGQHGRRTRNRARAAQAEARTEGGKETGDKSKDEKDKNEKRENADKEDKIPANNEAMRSKQVNDAAAYIRGLAQMRGRNAEWAEKAVRESVSLSATEALQMKVIDLIATDVTDLLKQVNGRKVSAAGVERTLNTQTAQVETIAADWRTKLLAVITDPSVAYILLLIGIYGLLLRVLQPGFRAAGRGRRDRAADCALSRCRCCRSAMRDSVC